MGENKNIDIEEFYEIFWTEYISENVISDGYLAIHCDLIWEITYNSYELWRKTDVKLSVIARSVEGVLLSIFKYEPPEGITFTKDLGEYFFK